MCCLSAGRPIAFDVRSLLQRPLNVSKNLPLRGFAKTVPRLNDNLQIRANCATWRATVFRKCRFSLLKLGLYYPRLRYLNQTQAW